MGTTFASGQDGEAGAEAGETETGSSQSKRKGGGTRETAIGRAPGNRDHASGQDAGAAPGRAGHGRDQPCGMGRVAGPPSPPAPRRRGPVTKLPNYRRIPGLLTGEAAANQSAAPLFSGRRPGDTRTFPHPGSRRHGLGVRAPPLSRGHAEFFSTVPRGETVPHPHPHPRVHAHAGTCMCTWICIRIHKHSHTRLYTKHR